MDIAWYVRTGLAFLLLVSQSDAKINNEGEEIATISAIRNQGLQGSEVMKHLSWLADVYGPRVQGTPALLDASNWSMTRFSSWGLSNVHREYFKFGSGWSMEKSAIRMVSPAPMQIIGYPVSWTPGTDGNVSADLVAAVLAKESDLTQWHGRLRGKIVMIQPTRASPKITLPLVHRFTEEELRGLREDTPVGYSWMNGERSDGSFGSLVPVPPTAKGLFLGEAAAQKVWSDRLIAYLKDEGAVAVFERGSDSAERSAVGSGELINTQRTQRIDGGTVQMPMGSGFEPGAADRLLPWIVIAVEQYNRIMRILNHGLPVTVDMDVGVKWYPEPPEGNGFNTFGEIRGSDLANQYVMIGAHLDGVHPATAAIDNGAGVAVVMEAMRLLKAVGAKPRRTIRVALWSGEEVGMLGSKSYVERHFGDPFKGPPYTAETANISAYFNIDNGSGRIRGFYARNNLAAVALLQKWAEPMRDLGVTTISPFAPMSVILDGRLLSGSDQMYFDSVGVPAFDTIQDRLDYFSRVYHSNMDYVDRASEPDLIQAAVVFATFAYEAAMSNEVVPRRAIGPPLSTPQPR